MTRQLRDISLIAKCLAGDDRAFGVLVSEYQPMVSRMFLNLTAGDSMLSDDLVQETFITVYSNLTGLSQLTDFRSWLMKVAYRMFCSHYRSRHNTVDLDKVPERQYDSCSHFDISNDVFLAMQLLSPNERICVTLNLLEDKSLKDISRITDIPLNTVKSHIRRGKDKLTDFLSGQGYGK